MSEKLSPWTSLSRREALRTLVGTTIGAGLAALAPRRPPAAQAPVTPPESAFRFLFMPDFHLRREHDSPTGMRQALTVAMQLTPRPAFIVNGGNLCHNVRDQTPTSAWPWPNSSRRSGASRSPGRMGGSWATVG